MWLWVLAVGYRGWWPACGPYAMTTAPRWLKFCNSCINGQLEGGEEQDCQCRAHSSSHRGGGFWDGVGATAATRRLRFVVKGMRLTPKQTGLCYRRIGLHLYLARCGTESVTTGASIHSFRPRCLTRWPVKYRICTGNFEKKRIVRVGYLR